MRAHFRTSPRFAVSPPWWLAIPAYLIWVTVALTYWMLLACYWTVVLGVQLAVRLWREYRPQN